MADARGHTWLAGEPTERRSAAVPDIDSLTQMQERFIAEYLIDLDGKQAAIRAGVPVGLALSRARSWMRHGLVREAIGRAMAERSKRVGLNADRVLARLGALALGDPTAIFNEQGGLRKPGEMDENDRLLIAGVKTRRALTLNPETGEMEKEEIVEVKTIDQLAAISLAMKHLGMLNEKIDVNVTSLADRLREAQMRRAGLLPGTGRVIEGEVVDDAADDTEEGRPGTDAEDGGTPHALAPPAASLGDGDLVADGRVIDWDPLA